MSRTEDPSFVVGIGASAGGLEALERFFKAMPHDSGMAFVVIQHLSPDFDSVMDELLARHTAMHIEAVTRATTIRANRVYLLTPKKEMVVENGCLAIRDKPVDQPLTMPINLFFRSLARDYGDRAIAIILSGTGSDGSTGILDIHELGGRILVQSEESAKFNGMPRAATSTGKADAVVSPEEMPDLLLEIAANPGGSLQRRTGLHSVSEALVGIPTIVDKLREVYGIDFTHYKAATITRRIDRRMGMVGCTTFPEYSNRVNSDATELDILYKDLLIGVTRFFRDREAFEILRSKVVPAILDRVPAEEEIRIWTPGCATGEEPYSIAMLFLEQLEQRKRPPNLKVFASDMHRDSLHHAAEGLYPESSLAEMEPDLIERFFVRESGGFRVVTALRKVLIFSSHNLIKDPPFTRMDLVSCRNLLIYFQSQAQLKALISFHFALKLEGVLFLGPSETVAELQGEFETIDRQWKIYRKIRESRLPLDIKRSAYLGTERDRAHVPFGPSADFRSARFYEALMQRYVPTGALINERREVMHIFGQADRFLRPGSGRISHDILQLTHGPLRLALSAALQVSKKRQEPVVYDAIQIEDERGTTFVTLTVEPIGESAGGTSGTFVRFETNEPTALSPSAAPIVFEAGTQSQVRIEELEHDLQQTKASLQSTVEQLETSNEELQASNEELLAANEELQSTNEELHSVNEELYSVNTEHEQKIDELDETTSDLHNLIRSTDIGTVFIDDELRIRLFTPTAARLFNLLPQDVGRDISHITYRVKGDEIIEAIRNVIAGTPVPEKTVVGPDSRRYQRRAISYRNQDNRPAGVVLTYVDVTDLMEAQERLRTANETLEEKVRERTADLIAAQDRLRQEEAITRKWLNLTTDGTWDRNLDTDEEYLSPGFKAMYGYADHELPNHATTQQRMVHPDDLALVNRTINEHALSGTPYKIPVRYRHKDGNIVWVLSRGVAIKDATGRAVRMVGTHTDITELKRTEEELRRLNDLLEVRVADRTRDLASSESRYRSVCESLPQLVWTCDAAGNCDYLGPQWVEYTGIPAAAQLGLGWLDQVHGDDRDRTVQAWRETQASEGNLDVEFRVRRRDGEYRWFKTRATPLRNESGRVAKWFGTSTDIDDLRRSEKQARFSEERFRQIVDNSPNGIILVDADGIITMANPLVATQFRCEVNELVGFPVEILIPERFRDAHRGLRKAFESAQRDRVMGPGREIFAVRKDQTEFPVEIGLQRLQTAGGIQVVATIVDISGRRAVERELRDSLTEKETMLKEIHHRVKNNMQLLSSLLHLQSDRVVDPAALAVLQQGQSRVQSLALIHEKLYQSQSLAHVNFRDYLTDLLSIVHTTHERSKSQIVTEVVGDSVMVGLDLGVPLGLLVNELVSNSFKHAFPGGRRGRIEVGLRRIDSAMIEVAVRDDGVGLPANMDWKSVKSLGLHLVKILTKQIEATTTARSGDGVEFLIRVPINPETGVQPTP